MDDKRFFRCFYVALCELDKRGFGFRLEDGLCPDVLSLISEKHGQTNEKVDSLHRRLCSVLPENPALINTTWFTRDEGEGFGSPKTGLPERVMEIFPLAMRDRMALTMGTVSRAPGLLQSETCLEIGRLLWGNLVSMPDTDSVDLLDRLALQSEDRLQRLVERLGMSIFARFLQHLPERSCVRLCRRLDAHLAQEVWTTRRRIAEVGEQTGENTWHPNREALEAGFVDNPSRSLRRMGGYVLCRALRNNPLTVRQIAQRLPQPLGKDILYFLEKPGHLGAEIECRDALSLLAGEMRISMDRLKQSCSRKAD